MSRRRKKTCSRNCPLEQQNVFSRELGNMHEEPVLDVRNILFHPITYMSTTGGSPDLDIHVPFQIKDGRLYLLNFMDSCGDVTVYIEMWKDDPDKLKGYEDALPIIKDVLAMQGIMGVEYYFGKADKAVEKWLYALQLFVEKGFLEKDEALELAGELRMDQDALVAAKVSLGGKMEAYRTRRNMVNQEEPSMASMVGFLKALGALEEEGKDDTAKDESKSGQ